MNYNKALEDYKKNGFAIVDNFLPENIADKLESMYCSDSNQWDLNDQVRDQAYGDGKFGKHKTDNPYLPREDEEYSAKFWRSNNLESEIESIFDDHFKPALKTISQTELTDYDIRCYKLDKGDYYRSHMDDYAGVVGCIYYVNKEWIWDWGGILNIIPSSEVTEATSIFPKFNRAVFLSHGGFKFPHFVNVVADYAKKPRFSVVSFNS